VSIATFAAAQILRLLPRSGLSHAVGRLCDRPLSPSISRAVTNLYVKAYGVDMQDVAPRVGTYPSFDEFFTRPLRDGVRVVSSDGLVSPADGRLVDAGIVGPDATLVVKGKPYSVAELVGDPSEAARYVGGCFAVVYLSPRDYHRVHSPVEGRVVSVRGIPGDLYPVNSIGERHVPGLFVKNQRVAITIDGGALGPVCCVMVGAMIVGRISVEVVPSDATPLGLHRLDPAVPVRRGGEIGKFHLGSTVVLLTGPKVAIARRPGGIRYGESLLVP
jgi:phosphatidylserine decarboxylase